MTRTVSQQIRQKFCFHEVPQNHVAVVMRSGQVARLCGPGDFWVNPLTEYVLEPIYVGLRQQDFRYQLLSADQVEFKLDLRLTFVFDPRIACKSYSADLALAEANSELDLQKLISPFVLMCLRELMAELSALQLIQETTLVQLEKKIRRTLRLNLLEYGVQLINNGTAITILNLHIPQSVRTALEFITVRNLLTNNSHLRPEEIEGWLLATKTLEQITNSGGVIHFGSAFGAEQNLLGQLVEQFTSAGHAQTYSSNGSANRNSKRGTVSIVPSSLN